MKNTLVTLALVLSTIPCFAKEPGSALFKPAVEKVPDQYIVLLNEDILPAHIPSVAAEMATRVQGRVIANFGRLKAFAVNAKENRIKALLHDPRVRQVEEVAIGHFSGVTTEWFPYGNTERWHLDRIDQREKIGTPSANEYRYSYTSDGSGVDVFVVDAGVEAGHAEFKPAQVTGGANYAGLDETDPDRQYTADNPCGGWGNQYPAVGFYLNTVRASLR